MQVWDSEAGCDCIPQPPPPSSPPSTIYFCGKAEVQPLFEAPFYAAMRAALRPSGRICTQAESMWLHIDLIKRMVSSARTQYDCAEYASTQGRRAIRFCLYW